MGGYGSGQWYRWQRKDTVNGRESLDVRAWQRQAQLKPGTRFGWGGLTVQVSSGYVQLSYRLWRDLGEGSQVDESIALTYTPCHYGGRRPWFRCPGLGCGRRVAKLYLGNIYFLCRRCHDLVYASQQQDPATRLMSKAQDIRFRLGGLAGLRDPFPSKPKGMHWRTYERLCWQAYEAEMGSMRAVMSRFKRVIPERHRSMLQDGE